MSTVIRNSDKSMTMETKLQYEPNEKTSMKEAIGELMEGEENKEKLISSMMAQMQSEMSKISITEINKEKMVSSMIETETKICEESKCDCNTYHDHNHDHDHDHNDNDIPVNTELLQVSLPSPSIIQQQSQIDQIFFTNKFTDLNRILNDNVQLAVWRKASTPKFVTELSDPSITAEQLPEFEGMVTPDNVAEVLEIHLMCFYQNRALSDEGIEELIQDIELLVKGFSTISQSKSIYVKLRVTSSDGCAYWHQDFVPLRLVTTYRGPSTEFVAPEFSNDTLLKKQFNSKHAQSLYHGDVALFKGRGYSRANLQGETYKMLDQPGIVHRSPRLSGTGVHRLVLVLNIPEEGLYE